MFSFHIKKIAQAAVAFKFDAFGQDIRMGGDMCGLRDILYSSCQTYFISA